MPKRKTPTMSAPTFGDKAADFVYQNFNVPAEQLMGLLGRIMGGPPEGVTLSMMPLTPGDFGGGLVRRRIPAFRDPNDILIDAGMRRGHNPYDMSSLLDEASPEQQAIWFQDAANHFAATNDPFGVGSHPSAESQIGPRVRQVHKGQKFIGGLADEEQAFKDMFRQVEDAHWESPKTAKIDDNMRWRANKEAASGGRTAWVDDLKDASRNKGPYGDIDEQGRTPSDLDNQIADVMQKMVEEKLPSWTTETIQHELDRVVPYVDDPITGDATRKLIDTYLNELRRRSEGGY